jgi:hypothetical protein
MVRFGEHIAAIWRRKVHTVKANKMDGNEFRIELPDRVSRVTGLINLRSLLDAYCVTGDDYAAFESDLLKKGKAEVSVSCGKPAAIYG